MKLQNPNPVRIRFLLGKLESGSCRTQSESGSKKSKIQFMHTSDGYGNFAILIQSDTFSSTPYPIHIWKFKIVHSDIRTKSETAHSVVH